MIKDIWLGHSLEMEIYSFRNVRISKGYNSFRLGTNYLCRYLGIHTTTPKTIYIYVL